MSKAASMLACPPAKKGRKALRDGGEVMVPINLGDARAESRSFADGGVVSPYSLLGMARAAGSAYAGAVNTTSDAMSSVASRFTRPPGYTPAVQAQPTAAPAPAAAPASNAIADYAGGQQNVMARREAAAGLADGGAVARMVQGPGTGISDSVPSKVRTGSYIVPADSTQNVLLSKGETELPPEAVHQVGVAALDALKTMTHVPAAVQRRKGPKKLANGGAVDYEYEDDKPSQAAPAGSAYALGIARGGQVAADRGQAMLDEARTAAPRSPVAFPESTQQAAAAEAAPAATPEAAPAAATDPDAPMPYGQQMANVGGALADMAGTAIKTLVSAPGYGFNRPSKAAAPSAGAPSGPGTPGASSSPGTQTDVQRGGAQVPPPVISVPGSQTGNIPGQDVNGAPGVKKQVQNGRTLYTNVDDPAGNAALLAPGGAPKPGGAADTLANSMDPALSAARRAAADRGDLAALRASYGDAGGAAPAGGAASQMAVVPVGAFGFKTPEEQGAAPPDTTGLSRRQIANLAMQRTQLASQDAHQSEQLQVQREGNATTRRGQDLQANTAAAQLASQAPERAADSRLKTTQANAAEAIQRAQQTYSSAKTPAARQQAEEDLRALQGKYEKTYPELFQTTVIPGEQDALGNKSPSRLAVLDKRDGGIKVYDASGQPASASQAKPLPPRDQLQAGTVYQTARGAARWDGKQFVPAQ